MNPSQEPKRPLSRKLYSERGETSRFIDVEIDEQGDLLISAQDVGRAPLEFWGDSDYEFWVRLPAAYKDELLLALMEKVYGGKDKAVDDFRSDLAKWGLPGEFGSWI